MILLTTIQKRLIKKVGFDVIRLEFDCRYLTRWINQCPECFPRFVIEGRYKIVFNNNLLRYELYRQ